MRVLVIEDDRETATFLKQALEEAGHVADMPATARPASPWRAPMPTTS